MIGVAMGHGSRGERHAPKNAIPGWHSVSRDRRLGYDASNVTVEAGYVYTYMGKKIRHCLGNGGGRGLFFCPTASTAFAYARGPVLCRTLSWGDVEIIGDKGVARHREVLLAADVTKDLRLFGVWCGNQLRPLLNMQFKELLDHARYTILDNPDPQPFMKKRCKCATHHEKSLKHLGSLNRAARLRVEARKLVIDATYPYESTYFSRIFSVINTTARILGNFQSLLHERKTHEIKTVEFYSDQMKLITSAFEQKMLGAVLYSGEK